MGIDIRFSVIILIICALSQAHGQNQSAYSKREPLLPKPLMNSIVYGIGAGTLVGIAAITGFKKNFAKNVDFGNVARGASYGLYGGILLGLYLTYGLDDERKEGSSAQGNENLSLQSNAAEKDGFFLTKSTTFLTGLSPSSIEPIFYNSKIDGLFVQWSLLKF